MTQQFDLVIIGAGAAGMSAAIYAGRAKLKTVVLEREREGGQIKITHEVENYPGILNSSGEELATTMRQQAEKFGVNFAHATVERVDFEGDVKHIYTNDGEYTAQAVIIATGAVPRTANFEGEEEFAGRGVGYCATCDGEFFTGLEVFVIGGGLAAAEEALYLTRFARKVTILVRKDKLAVPRTIAEKVEHNEKIELRYNTELTRVGGDRAMHFAEFTNNATKETSRFDVPNPNETFGIFVFAGYAPQTTQFEGILELDEQGCIITDEGMRTNVDGIFAAGDVRPKELRQLATAVADGAIAATNAEKHIEWINEKLGIASPSTEPEATEEPKSVKAGPVFFDEDLAEQLASILERLQNQIGIVAVIDRATGVGEEIHQFLEEFSALTSKVSIEYLPVGADPLREQELGAIILPSIVLVGADGQPLGVQFHSVPAGHELDSFVLSLYNAAGPGQTIPENQARRIAALDKKANIKIGVLLSCTMCPDVVAAAQLIALRNPNVTAEMIDLRHYPEFKEHWDILSVPAIVINDEQLKFGKLSLDELVDLVS
jgi:thioredoxin reductase (NADPH)